MYKIEELRAKSRNELLNLISELKGKLLALRFESATGQLSESHLPSATKKDIAKIFTVLKEKELGIEHVAKEKVSDTSKQKTKVKEEKVEPTTTTTQLQPTTKEPEVKEASGAKPTVAPFFDATKKKAEEVEPLVTKEVRVNLNVDKPEEGVK